MNNKNPIVSHKTEIRLQYNNFIQMHRPLRVPTLQSIFSMEIHRESLNKYGS